MNKYLNTVQIACFAVLLMGASLQAQAQWKWRDASGNITVSDRPPPADIPEKNILHRPNGSAHVTPIAPAAAPASSAKGTDPELEARLRKEKAAQDAEQAAAKEQQAKAKAENCARARSYQQTLNSGMRIATTDANGQRTILDDAGRAQEQAKTNQVIQSDCQ